MIKRIALIVGLLSYLGAAPAAPAAPRPMQVADAQELHPLAEAQISPDGLWVAYTVQTANADKDKLQKDLWMTSTDGKQHLRLTHSGDVNGKPRWDPQGQWLTFLASRGEDEEARKNAQVWRLNRSGGEAQQVTTVKTGVNDFRWSPDGKHMVLVVTDADPRDEPEKMEGWKRKTKPPIVLDRFHFKQDIEGYLGQQKNHLFVLDLATSKLTQLTTGNFSETAPAWSPDGRQIAFLSNRSPAADRTEETSLFVMDLPTQAEHETAAPRKLATFTADEDSYPLWSPDGRHLAFLMGGEVRLSAYQRYRLAKVSRDGGPVEVLGQSLERGFQNAIAWAPDARSLYGIVDDDRSSYMVRVNAVTGGANVVERLTPAQASVSYLSIARDGTLAVLAGNAKQPDEVHLLPRTGTASALQRLTHQNDDWLANLQMGRTQEFSATSSDNNVVHGLATLPPNYRPGQKYPTVLFIHGGPNGQDSHHLGGFNEMMRELLSAHGYAVLQVNYRGSSGRGDAYQQAIYADWGNKEVKDLLAAVDWAVQQGIADPTRLGLGGWSYGGILTDYLIASDTRFKAAVSGAGSANQISMFGSDQYSVQYEREMGAPWVAQENWIKVSYPFFHADHITTPTLFMGGEQDFNVPIAGGEQMYQALKMLGVDTQLVIYPGQTHGIKLPSYRRDVQERYLAWFEKYLGH